MIKLNMRSQYDHFPHRTTDDDSSPRMYVDGKIWEAREEPKRRNDLLMLIEPRSIQPGNYDLVMREYSRFKYIFTHDSQLLTFAPNALPIYYWRDYELKDVQKNKGISMICGTKDLCPLHHERMKIADAIMDRVDVLGDYNGDRCTIDEAYSGYKFAVVIENYRDDYWFTEKILNAFSHKTIPIYYGARRISEIFNGKGIIEAKSLWDIPDIIDILLDKGLNYEYYRKYIEIEHNYRIVQAYADFEDYFFKKYDNLLSKMEGL